MINTPICNGWIFFERTGWNDGQFAEFSSSG